MAYPLIKTAFVAGEIAPALFGHVDYAKFPLGASTMRNFFVSYTGGAYSRAGTKFVGFSKQTGRSVPPRLITFQFSINQGLALEFGNFYMRVVQNGAFVTEPSLPITNATRANPGVISVSTEGALSATPNNAGVSSSYAPGDRITLDGGTFSIPGILDVTTTKLLSVAPNNPGTSGYVPGDTVTLGGGTQTVNAIVDVDTTKVVSATIAAPGSGGTDGTQTVTGTTGTGTKFQAEVTIAGGVITAVNSITVAGSYSVNPTTIAAEPVTGASLSSAELSVSMGIDTTSIANAGIFSANALGGDFVQAATSGAGAGATFSFGLFGIVGVSVVSQGSYTATPGNPVSAASTTGTGVGATFNVVFGALPTFSDGDWVQIEDVGGMTQLNGQTYVVANSLPGSFTLRDVYGNNINTTAFGAYTGGGTVARVFTLATPYAEADLKYLKYTQSKDVMTLTCWNQQTDASYPAYDLARFANNNWTLDQTDFSATIDAPSGGSATASSGGSTNYSYEITAVNPDDGTESLASTPIILLNAVNVATTAGQININWTAVPTVEQYNIYKATQSGVGPVPIGALHGFIGSAYGVQFNDTNVAGDFTQVPPLHRNPFAPGQIIGVTPNTGGTGYTQATIGYTITTAAGSGLVLSPIVTNGALAGFIIDDAGENYADGDTITITDSGVGTGATATLMFGASSGTNPSVAAYFQQRRVYAATPNAPDTYFMSQPGAFTNMDSRIPTTDADAITGSPWSQQVNGIQFLVSMPGGLVALTGQQAWQLTGAGGSSLNPQPITPANQQAQPQAFNGCNDHVPPLQIDYDILYVQAKGSIVRVLAYNFFVNIYTGSDITKLSSHLFTGYQLDERAWCEEPFKVVWFVRNDGILLNLCYVKPEEIAGWTRHDTNGFFESVCSVTEVPVDALYTAVQRFPGSNTAYMIERMDDRLWPNLESVWAVDCGLSLDQPEPDATLTVSSATGLGACTGVTGLVGGTGYSSATTFTVVDDNGQGPGTGATVAATIVSGVITAITFPVHGTKYTYPKLVANDPGAQGRGFAAVITLDNSATFTTNVDTFVIGDIGDVIRCGGGKATITGFNTVRSVTANITSPIVQNIVLNSGGTVAPFTSGNWTQTTLVTTLSGLNHLNGMSVTGLADGEVIAPQTVVNGAITLSASASAIVVGLGFTAQLQGVYLEVGGVTVQGQRKKIAAVNALLQSSKGGQIGANQKDGSVQSPMQLAPTWDASTGMVDIQNKGRAPYGSTTRPLFTGYVRIPVPAGFGTTGQPAIQQTAPLPLECLSWVVELLPGDQPENEDPKSQDGRRDRAA